MSNILNQENSEVLVPILCFYMEENNLQDVFRAMHNLRLDLMNLETKMEVRQE